MPAVSSLTTIPPAADPVRGIVLDAVAQFSGQSGGIDLTASGIVINTVNSIHRLEMAALASGRAGHDAGPIARVAASSELANRAGTAHPMSRGIWDVQALSGYSVKMIVGDEQAENSGASSERIVIDTMMRDRIIFVQISNTLDHARHGHVENYKVLQADGKPLPGWVDAAENGTLLVQAPIVGGTLDLRIVATLDDGRTIERGVALHLATGHVKELETDQSSAPMFEQQIKRRNAL